uniref:DNA polymerase n=1 Tax=Chenopodium quinoa TaxID=63459 RepID=A0A803KXY4_CHEQI
MEEDDQPTIAGRRRSRGANGVASARAQALERLKAMRNGENRPSYDIKMDAPIYDTFDEDEYKTIVAKRREEFSDFVVGDVGDGYIDDGEEEDWTKAGMPFSSDEEFDGEDGKGMLSCDSVVDDVIAEFAPDDRDRERRRRPQSKNLGLGLGVNGIGKMKVEKPVVSDFLGKVEEDHRPLSPDLAPKDRVTGDKSVVEVENSDELNPFEGDFVSGGEKEEKLSNAIDAKIEPALKEGQKVFSFNAKIKEEKVQTFSAAAEWQAINGTREGNGAGCEPVKTSSIPESEDKSEFVLETDGSLPFYILDAYEELYNTNAGTVYLFGKVKAGNAYHSCCVVVKNMQRCLYAIPSASVFHNEEVMKLEKDFADKKITAAELCTKLHEVASGLKAEMAKHLVNLNVSTFSMAPVKRSYAFERVDIPHGENYVLEINYPFKDPPLQPDLKGDTFCTVLGALELFLVKRKIKGPSWLSVSKFSSRPSHQRVSWCKFEIAIECPEDIKESASTKNTAVIPPVIVTAISLKTIINEKQNVNEIVSASIISCSKAKIDTPMLASEWKRPGVLNHFTVVRKLGGDIWPMKFQKEVAEKNTKAGSTILVLETSERALLSCLMTEMYKLDSDFLVGHNISGFDLDVLLHRAQACRLPSSMWSKIGRLKRATMPKLTKGSTIFGSGASPGIMSCIAGRLSCDTYLCSRDLLKEVSYSLTQLAKTQLNKDRKEIAPKEISSMYQRTESLMDLIECNETDAWLSMELMFHLNILPLTRQLTNISGNLWGKTLQGARAQRVEYLLLHAFHEKNYIVPDKYSSYAKENKLTKRKIENGDDVDMDKSNNENEPLHEDNGKGKKGPAYAGGLVLDPKRGLYDKYVLLLDFNSLYPSIIQEYNICFTTVERYSDGSVPRIPSCEKTGVLPELLKNLVERRRMVKSWLKTASGLKAQQFDIQQQALKLTANSMYGCLGFSNSRFYAKPLAELITLQGREILQSTVDLVQNTLNLEARPLILLIVIYGDTDSIMIYSGLDDIAKAKAIAGKVIQEHSFNGLAILFELFSWEICFSAFLCVVSNSSFTVIERKGLDMVRRDWSLLSKEVGDYCLSQILSGGSCEDVVESIHSYLMKVQEEMRKGEVPLEKYIITKSLTKQPEAYPDAKNQPHVQVALRLKHNGYTAGCSSGDTVPYIICCEQGTTSGTSGGIAQRARHPDELKTENLTWMIDINYYLSQQIHPVVSRLCASIQGTDPARLADCLGLDSAKFQSKSDLSTGNDPSSSLLSSVDDEDRYQDCEPLILSCPSCSGSFDCPSIFSSLCKSVAEKPNEAQPEKSTSKFCHRLRCPKCPEEGDVGQISPAMIANQVKRQADGFISKYYRGLMTCDDETCKYTTRSLNLRVIGDSERGTVCPNYPRCNGRLVRKYSEVDLYKQLTYFCHILDTVRCIEKIDGAARPPFEKELIRIRPLVDSAAIAAQKLRDRCAFGWVQLNDLFVTLCT